MQRKFKHSATVIHKPCYIVEEEPNYKSGFGATTISNQDLRSTLSILDIMNLSVAEYF